MPKRKKTRSFRAKGNLDFYSPGNSDLVFLSRERMHDVSFLKYV